MAGRGDRLGTAALLRDHLSVPAGIVLRPLGPDDATAYRAFRLASLAAFPDAFLSSAEEEALTSEEWLVRRLTPSPTNVVLGAFTTDGDLVGTAGLQRLPRAKERHKTTLFGMVVARHHWGRGIGRALVHAVIERARAWEGVELIELTVTASNEGARGLYLAAGFVPFGVEPRALKLAGRYYAKEHMQLELVP